MHSKQILDFHQTDYTFFLFSLFLTAERTRQTVNSPLHQPPVAPPSSKSDVRPATADNKQQSEQPTASSETPSSGQQQLLVTAPIAAYQQQQPNWLQFPHPYAATSLQGALL